MVLLRPIIKRRLRGGSTHYLATVRVPHPAAESLVIRLLRTVLLYKCMTEYEETLLDVFNSNSSENIRPTPAI